MVGKRRKKGDWIAIANQRARISAPAKYKTIEQCLVLPRKVRKIGNQYYPRQGVGS